MKIALIAMNDENEKNYWQSTSLGLGALKAFIDSRHTFDIQIFEKFDDILSFQPDLVGMSTVTLYYHRAIEVAKKIKATLRVPIIIGGCHITSLPASLHNTFDMGILGEGELTFEEILLEYADKTDFNKISLYNIKGIVFKSDTDETVITVPREFIRDLDTLPYPWRDIRQQNYNEVAIFTSRGCPYRCIFCSSTQHWRGQFRAMSAEKVVGEIEKILIQFPNTRSIRILDDLFIVDKKRLKKLVELLEAKNINKRLEFNGVVRANLVDDETCRLFTRMNLTKLHYGAETGSERLLSLIKGNSVSCRDNQQVINLCSEYNIECHAFIMVGVPGETEEDLMLTHRFLKSNVGKLKLGGFFLFQPLPGTPIWDQLFPDNLDYDYNWEAFNIVPFAISGIDVNLNNYFNHQQIKLDRFLEILRCYFAEYLPMDAFAATVGQYLEIGSGNHPHNGFVHCDKEAFPHVEYICDATNMSVFSNETMQQIYCRHVLEYLDRIDAILAVLEMKRVLKSGGTIHLIVPNIEFYINQFHSNQEEVFYAFWGEQRNSKDIRKWGYTAKSLIKILRNCGFDNIVELTSGLFSYEKDIKCLEIIATKNSINSEEYSFSDNELALIAGRLLESLYEGKLSYLQLKHLYRRLEYMLAQLVICDNAILFEFLFNKHLDKERLPSENLLLAISRYIPTESLEEFIDCLHLYNSKGTYSLTLDYLAGSLYEKKSMYPQALERFNFINQLPIPKTRDQEIGIMFHMAFNNGKMGLVEKAIKFTNKCLLMEPNHVKARELLENLLGYSSNFTRHSN
ncbi:MAG: radical SAM protein [Sporomusaceae bacterium]|nr:radical SAM protein [Sporomusaceae bacterium]